ncbi:histidine kinase dimerization/phospho-acceptor domain-containing protein [Sphingomonas aerolata]|uniref:histidine kinase dimerization/phospho-acceptor domain-containing protein n=1 Tax=Sphingomonas aerolata TaxID=185951 RepID=UPI002FE07FB9
MTRPPRSLMAQILRWHAIAVLITAVAVAGGVYLFLDTTAARIQHQTVHVHAHALRQALSQDATGRLHLTQDRTSAAVFAPGAGFAFRIVDPRGAVLFRSDSPILVPLAAIPLSDEERFFRRQSRYAFYAGASSPARVGSARVWIVVLQNLTHPDYILDDLLAQFLLYGLAIVTPVLLLLLAIDVLIIRRAVAPVRRASASLRTDDALPLDLRVNDDRLPAEVRPLARAVNALLERLTSSYRMQRDFIADAAHELRTPIAVARLRVEEVEDATLRATLRSDLDTLGRDRRAGAGDRRAGNRRAGYRGIGRSRRDCDRRRGLDRAAGDPPGQVDRAVDGDGQRDGRGSCGLDRQGAGLPDRECGQA